MDFLPQISLKLPLLLLLLLGSVPILLRSGISFQRDTCEGFRLVFFFHSSTSSQHIYQGQMMNAKPAIGYTFDQDRAFTTNEQPIAKSFIDIDNVVSIFDEHSRNSIQRRYADGYVSILAIFLISAEIPQPLLMQYEAAHENDVTLVCSWKSR